MLKLIIDQGDYINAVVSGISQKLESDPMSGKMLDALFRYDMMHRTGYTDDRNPHVEYVLKYFEPFDGYYVMSVITADTLAKSGRNMNDVFIYDYSSDNAVLRNYLDRNLVL